MKFNPSHILSIIAAFMLANCMSAKNVTLEDLGLEKLEDGSVSISRTINLEGNTLLIPSGVTLDFTGEGSITSGTVTGNNTAISNGAKEIFDKITINGSWNVPEISTAFFVKPDNNTLSNLSAMLSATVHNTLRIDNPCTVPIDINWSSRFIIKSNTDVIFNEDISAAYSELPGGYAMLIDGSNINIYGNGHTLTGTIKQARRHNAIMEHQHGVFITKNARNVTVDSLRSNYFCGDGFYNQGSDVTFNRVSGKYNGRQGLSICGGNNIHVRNSEFTDTGKLGINKSNGPGAGLDIEPSDGMKVNNVLIENCVIKNNYRYMDGYVNDLEVYDTGKTKVTVRNCTFGGLYLGNCSGLTIENCRNIKTIYGVDTNISGITIRNCGRPRLSPKVNRIINLH